MTYNCNLKVAQRKRLQTKNNLYNIIVYILYPPHTHTFVLTSEPHYNPLVLGGSNPFIISQPIVSQS